MARLAIQWTGGLSFVSTGDGPAMAMASGDRSTPSPMQLLAHAIMGCMGMDVAYVLARGHHELAAMTVTFDGQRAETHPRRYTAITLHFDVTTSAAPAVIERAIALSRTKYCSVWHTIRPDVVLTTSFIVRPTGMPSVVALP